MNHVHFLVAPRIEKSRDFSAHVVCPYLVTKVRSTLQIGGVRLFFYLENHSAIRIFLLYVISSMLDINISRANRAARSIPDSKNENAKLMQISALKLNL